ncbi:hypothetical protein E4U41_005515 [Claviceps citrina]|nr:hypothetical protein E4U41_005515 [Claviceps citrina]
MGNAVNIENLLNTGYFTTSRARSRDPSARAPLVSRDAPPESNPPPVPAHGHIPRTVHLVPAPSFRKNPPPPPATVEDEIESLAKEYGSSQPSVFSEEEPLSRGDLDQNPIIVQVHEHNPERRFVIVTEDAKDQPPVAERKPSVERHSGTDDPRDRIQEPNLNIPNDGSDADLPPSGSKRSQFKQDVPSIDTKLDSRHVQQHQRTRSAAPRSKPDHFDNRQSRPHVDESLSPEIISSGPKVRDKTYHGTPESSGAQCARSPSRTRHHFEGRNRGTERDHHTHNRTSSTKQSAADLENGHPRRRMTSDVSSRYRDEYLQASNDKRDGSHIYARPEGPRPRISPRGSRDSSSVRYERRDESCGHSRSTSRTSTFPMTATEAGAAAASAMAYEATTSTSRDAATPAFRLTEPTGKGTSILLPYPDDDLSPDVSLDIRDVPSDARQSKARETWGINMPEPIPIRLPVRSFDPTNGMPTAPAAMNTSQPWNPAPFDPDKDGLPTERPMGACRRFSEDNGKDGTDILPECPRQKPVAGLMDWLTLPHTNFNLCPSCYNAVFAKSEHRNLFKPMLRPFNEPILCDFGASPWYRIAWLLTLKDHVPDLRLLQQIASVGAASNGEPCPGSKKMTRSWLTVKDPHTRRPVGNFSVCYQCARIVELLLPNLTGVFEPVDFRARTDVCALHFAPGRKQFVLFFDALETTSDIAMLAKKPPDVADLARKLWYLTVGAQCREDTPVIDGYWHMMQFLKEFTVCGNCFEDVVRPKLDDGNVIARNFYTKPQRLPSATCQLYSARMREVFRRSCRGNDPKYLEEKVIQRRRKEKDIYDQLVMVDRANATSSWKEEQVGKLVDEWRRWE